MSVPGLRFGCQFLNGQDVEDVGCRAADHVLHLIPEEGESFISMKSGLMNEAPELMPPGMCDQSARLKP